jgi:hypothetical protein
MLNRQIKYLRGLGSAGGWAANAIQILTYILPGLTISVIGASIVAYFNSALEWVRLPTVYITAATFLFILWTYIGLSAIIRRRKPQIVTIHHDYAYGLSPEGMLAMVGSFPSNHPIRPNGKAIAIVCNFRNASAGPLRMRIEEARVNLNNKSNDESINQVDLILPRMAQKSIRIGAIPVEQNEDKMTGSVILRLNYGHPDEEFSRTYIVRTKIQVIASSGQAIPDDIIEERDIPYIPW